MTIELSALAIGMLSRPIRSGASAVAQAAGAASSFESILQALRAAEAPLADPRGQSGEVLVSEGESDEGELEDEESGVELAEEPSAELVAFEPPSSEPIALEPPSSEPAMSLAAGEVGAGGDAQPGGEAEPPSLADAPLRPTMEREPAPGAPLERPSVAKTSPRPGAVDLAQLSTSIPSAPASSGEPEPIVPELVESIAIPDRMDRTHGLPRPKGEQQVRVPEGGHAPQEVATRQSSAGVPANMLVLSPAFVAKMPRQPGARGSTPSTPVTAATAPDVAVVGRAPSELLEPAYRAPLEQAMAPTRTESRPSPPAPAIALDEPTVAEGRERSGEARPQTEIEGGDRRAIEPDPRRMRDAARIAADPERWEATTTADSSDLGLSVDPQKGRALVDVPIATMEPSSIRDADHASRNEEISALVDRMLSRRAVHATLVDSELGRVGVHVEASSSGLDLRVDAVDPKTLNLLVQSRGELETHLKTEAVPVARLAVVQAPEVALRPVSGPLSSVLDPRRPSGSSMDLEEPPTKEERPRRSKANANRRVRVVM